MSRRIFVGLALPPELPQEFAEAWRRLRTSASKGDYRFKWTERENLHLTLKFIGQTDRTEEVIAAMQRLASVRAGFELELHGFGAFPDDLEARVVWAGARSKINLRALAEAVEAELAGLGFAPEGRDFHPHITLARVKSKQSVKDLLSPFLRKELGSMPVRALTVYESVSGGAFPRYVPLAQFPLLPCLASAGSEANE